MSIKRSSPLIYFILTFLKTLRSHFFAPASIVIRKGSFFNITTKSVKKDMANIDLMSGREFENFIASLYKDLGNNVVLTPESGDQGVDVIVTDRNNNKFAIQTKRYYGNVGNSAVQEVIAGRKFHNCSKAIVLTNSYFTKSAIALAFSDGQVELIDRDGLKSLISKAINNQNL